jgi:hypothetical protein
MFEAKNPVLIACLIALSTGVVSAQPQQPLNPPLKDWKVANYWAPTPETKTEPRSAAVAANSSATPLAFVAIPPCRLLDTRASSGMTGAFGPPSLIGDPTQTGADARTIPVPSSSCGIPVAAAYSLYLVVVPPPGIAVGFLSAWPDDQPWPGTATVNASAGGIVGNSAIVPSGSDGGIKVFATNSTDLVIDINGYFLDQPAIHFRGPWSVTASYVAEDIVTFAPFASPASSYIALAASQGSEPDTDVTYGGLHWGILAQAGAAGLQGSAGPPGPSGLTGPAGQPGAVGQSGAAGQNGAQGPAGPQGPPISFQGTWNNSTTYVAGAAVFYNGSSYSSLAGANVGNVPTAGVPWALFVQQGSTGGIGPTGPTGGAGPTGPAGPAGPQGTQGVAGPIGPIGAQGVAGPTGATGAIGPAGPPISFQGIWSGAITYAAGAAVFLNGSSYISMSSGNLNQNPTGGAPWAVLAQQGSAGPTGPTGPAGSTGAQGPQGVAGPTGPTGNTGAPGSAGSTGSQGPQGAAGTPGAMGNTGAQGPQGTPGAAGATGATGTATIYGDGSDGTTTSVCDITINPTNWVTTPPTTDIQCTNFTVASGVTLTVPSGTLIHASGTVTITGTLTVQPGAAQGLYIAAPSLNNYSATGGVSLNTFTLRKLLNPGPFGGGNGGTEFLNGTSGLGGGSIVILAAGAISIGASGSINANGANGLEEDEAFADGGGAGGIVILASKTSILNSGSINANGGNGANAVSNNNDAAGGGGGGLIHLLAPGGQLTGGIRNFAGGSAGTGAYNGNGDGFGGGALAGNGGAGAYGSSATAGTAGLSLVTTVADPATLFVP